MAPCREDCSLVPDLFVLWLSPFLSLSKTIPEGVGKRAETDRHPGQGLCLLLFRNGYKDFWKPKGVEQCRSSLLVCELLWLLPPASTVPWVHLNCLKWLPHLHFFMCTVKMKSLSGIEMEPLPFYFFLKMKLVYICIHVFPVIFSTLCIYLKTNTVIRKVASDNLHNTFLNVICRKNPLTANGTKGTSLLSMFQHVHFLIVFSLNKR